MNLNVKTEMSSQVALSSQFKERFEKVLIRGAVLAVTFYILSIVAVTTQALSKNNVEKDYRSLQASVALLEKTVIGDAGLLTESSHGEFLASRPKFIDLSDLSLAQIEVPDYGFIE